MFPCYVSVAFKIKVGTGDGLAFVGPVAGAAPVVHQAGPGGQILESVELAHAAQEILLDG